MPDLPKQPLNIAAKRPVNLPSGAASAKADGAFALGRSMQNASKDVASIEIEVRNFQDRGHEAETKRMMLRAEREHILWREDNQDEAKWIDDWDKRTGPVMKYAGSASMLPDNRQHLDDTVRNWQEAGGLGVAIDSRKQSIYRAGLAQENYIYDLRHQRRYDEAKQAVMDLPGKLPEERNAIVGEIERQQYTEDMEADVARWKSSKPEDIVESIDEWREDDRFDERSRIEGESFLNRKLEREGSRELQEIVLDLDKGGVNTEQQFRDMIPEWMPRDMAEKAVTNWNNRFKELTGEEKALIDDHLHTLQAEAFSEMHDKGGSEFLDVESYENYRNGLYAEISPMLMRRGASDYISSFNRSSVASVKSSFDNWRTGKTERPEFLADKIAIYTGFFNSVKTTDGVRGWPKEQWDFYKSFFKDDKMPEIEARWKATIDDLLIEFPNATRKEILDEFIVRDEDFKSGEVYDDSVPQPMRSASPDNLNSDNPLLPPLPAN